MAIKYNDMTAGMVWASILALKKIGAFNHQGIHNIIMRDTAKRLEERGTTARLSILKPGL
jgi:hypothetical protein